MALTKVPVRAVKAHGKDLRLVGGSGSKLWRLKYRFGGRDCTTDLRGALTPVTGGHFAAITEPARIGELLRAIDGYARQPSVAYALRLPPYVCVRPGEPRQAEWKEFDLDAADWRILAERMKAGESHLLPFSRQVIDLLRALHQITRDGRYLLPSLRSSERPIGDNTLNAALRRRGYSGEEMTGHGVQTMASTTLNERGWHPDLIELQLAHAERNKGRGAYNHAERLAVGPVPLNHPVPCPFAHDGHQRLPSRRTAFSIRKLHTARPSICRKTTSAAAAKKTGCAA